MKSMALKVKAAKIFALAMILALPLVLSGCGKKAVPASDNSDAPLDQTSGQGGLAPAGEAIDGSGNLFDNSPQSGKEIKNDADIEDILNNIDKEGGKTLQDVDDSDLNNF